MTFPLMPFSVTVSRGELLEFATTDTNDIQVGDALMILQSDNSTTTITTPTGATSLWFHQYSGNSGRGSIKIAEASDVGATWDKFSAVAILRHTKGKPLAFSPALSSGSNDPSPYNRPVGVLSSIYRDDGTTFHNGTVNGVMAPAEYTAKRGADLWVGVGAWGGDYGAVSDVVLDNVVPLVQYWRFAYVA